MKFWNIALLFITFSLCCQYVYSQESEKIIIGERITLKSEILGHEREISICLPPNYNESNQSFPVIYTTDAETSFALMASTFEVFNKGGILPNAIVVGIINRGEKERYIDFAPVIKGKPESGRAELFIDFFEKELFPYIENKYRTQPFRIIFGHSFLGMFASHVFLTHPNLFQGYVISSPDLRWIHEDIANQESVELLQPTFLYLSKGSNERTSKEIEAYVERLKTAQNLNYVYVDNKNENHQSNGVISIINGFRFIYSDWSLPKPPRKCSQTEIKNHYLKLSEKYGYDVPNPYVRGN